MSGHDNMAKFTQIGGTDYTDRYVHFVSLKKWIYNFKITIHNHAQSKISKTVIL